MICHQETENISKLVLLGKKSKEGREQKVSKKDENVMEIIQCVRQMVLAVSGEFQSFVWLRGKEASLKLPPGLAGSNAGNVSSPTSLSCN